MNDFPGKPKITRRAMLFSLGTTLALPTFAAGAYRRSLSTTKRPVALDFSGPFDANRFFLEEPFCNDWLRIETIQGHWRDQGKHNRDALTVRFSVLRAPSPSLICASTYGMEFRGWLTDRAGVEYRFLDAQHFLAQSTNASEFGNASFQLLGGVYELPLKLREAVSLHFTFRRELIS